MNDSTKKMNTHDNQEITILLVDDTPTNLELIISYLKQEGYKTAVAKNGKTALMRAEYLIPDLILLDIQMPEIDGFETCQKLKENQTTSDIPVIFMSALTETVDKLKGFQVGGVDYITKPVNCDELLARVNTHVTIRLLQKELIKKNADLINLNELKNKYLGMAAHDLRNPLNGIQGLSLLLTDDEVIDEKEKKTLMRQIHKSSCDMLKLVDDLLNISSIESGGFELDQQSTPLDLIVQERIELITIVAKTKNIIIESNLDSVPNIQMDINRMSQVIDNLLSNAIKFSNSGTKIFVHVSQKNDRVLLSIKDQGQGIPSEEIGLLFNAFRKLSIRPTDGEVSTGLGMWIVKNIIDAHSGKISVESEVNVGSTFTVSLPI